MRILYSSFNAAETAAEAKVLETNQTWYVNRLASSGLMRYEVSDQPITDTSFGGGVVVTVMPSTYKRK